MENKEFHNIISLSLGNTLNNFQIDTIMTISNRESYAELWTILTNELYMELNTELCDELDML